MVQVEKHGPAGGVRRHLEILGHDPVRHAVPVRVRGHPHRLVERHRNSDGCQRAGADQGRPRRRADGCSDRDVAERDDGAVAAVRIRLGHVVRRPELIRDGDPHAGQRLRAGPHGAVHPCAVVVAEEDDAVLHGRPRVKVRDPFDGPGRDLRLFFLRLVVVHRLPRRRVVRGVGERIVVRGAVDDPPVGEVPRRDGRIRSEGRAEPGDSRVRGVQVLRRVTDVRPVEHGVVEGRLVHDCRARNLVARLHEL